MWSVGDELVVIGFYALMAAYECAWLAWTISRRVGGWE
jgi:hypothetical protein